MIVASLCGVVLFTTGLAAAVCPGDCDGNGTVTIVEVIRGVSIALGRTALTECPAFDRNADGQITVNELISAIAAVLHGCVADTPTATPSSPPTGTVTDVPTASDTVTATPTTTATPPETPTATLTSVPSPFIYRTFPGFEMALPLGVSGAEGGALACSVDMLPAGAVFDPDSAVVNWTPASDQLGPFYMPFTCHDDATPAASVDGQLTVAVAARDDCAMPACDPATGCTTTLPPPAQVCCAAGPAQRVAEPVAGCPEGRVLYIGRNSTATSFGRVQNCDKLHMSVFQQAGAQLVFHIETRCVNTNNRVRIHARLDTASPDHLVLFDTEPPPVFLDTASVPGFAVRRNLRFGIVGGGPFFDLEGAEGNLTVTLTDQDGVSVTERVRVILGSMEQLPELPDVDPPLPTPTATATP